MILLSLGELNTFASALNQCLASSNNGFPIIYMLLFIKALN